MQEYRELAQTLFSLLERRRVRPPHADMDAALRGEMAVLRLVHEEACSMTAGEISRRLDMKTPRIAAVLRALEKKGLILRQADTVDKRRVMVTITEKGHTLCREKRGQAILGVTNLLRALGEEDARHLVRIMARIQDEMNGRTDLFEEKEEADEQKD